GGAGVVRGGGRRPGLGGRPRPRRLPGALRLPARRGPPAARPHRPVRASGAEWQVPLRGAAPLVAGGAMTLLPPELRADFPLLARERAPGRPLVYLDSAATSLKPRRVIDAVAA